jgi:hypothetical protein
VKRGLYAAWLAVDVERLQKQYPWADIVAAEKV